MRYCMKLLPEIQYALFAPDYEGEICWQVKGNFLRIEIHRSVSPELGSFRKPGPGMLQYAMAIEDLSESLMIGDRPEDKGAASAAGISFLWAEDWITQ